MKSKTVRFGGAFLVLCLAAVWAQQQVTLVDFVHGNGLMGNFALAEKGLAQYRAARGITPEYLQALSWVGRDRLQHKDLADAQKNAAEVMKLSEAELAHRKLDAEPLLPLALGAGIEVQAQSLVAQNRRDE